jgi:hypothetical protein
LRQRWLEKNDLIKKIAEKNTRVEEFVEMVINDKLIRDEQRYF